ncbi:MAG: c-type cytochrome [Pirellulales bacterium]
MQKPDASHYVRGLGIGLALALLAAGCARQPELAFKAREEMSSLPAKHQEQIGKFLDAYFGSPSTPRYLLPAPEGEGGDAAASDGTSDESGAGESGASSDVRLFDNPAWSRRTLKLGAEVYTRQCAPCHGTSGDGMGPAANYLNPPPRDYRLGRFKFTSTPRGIKPRHEDLVRIVRRGAKGTSMPSFRWMPDDELEAVIGYVMVLASRGEMELQLMRLSENDLEETDDVPAAEAAGVAQRIHESWDEAATLVVNPITTEPRKTPETVQRGAKAFIELNCFKCHGKDGRGNKAFNVGKDDWGRTAFAADLTSGMLHGGRRPIDIYRRIYSGINGTPMPAFSQPDTNKGETEQQRSETIWHLVHFVQSVVDGEPLPMELIEETIKSMPAAGEGGDAAPSSDDAATEAQPTSGGEDK